MDVAFFPTTNEPFIGRKRERAEIRARLTAPECRLLTVTGLGGCGKTRLALTMVEELRGEFPQGAGKVSLQHLPSVDILVYAIAQTLDVPLSHAHDPEGDLFHYLANKQMLLLLDNFEHLLDGTPLLARLLAACPHVTLLVTSREPLNLREEWLYPLQGLNVPQSEYSGPVETYDAIQLFCFHARKAQPSFAPDDERDALLAIGKLTAGLPLALEMAASWLRGMSASQVAQELRDNLGALSSRMRDTPDRHRSMRAVLEQSWAMLTPAEQSAFARLSVFGMRFEGKAAIAVSGATYQEMAGLVERGFLQLVESDYYAIHELLRQFGQEQLEARNGRAEALDAHAEYYSQQAQQREGDLKGLDQAAAASWMSTNCENIYRAWTWASTRQNLPALQRMVEGLLWYSFIRAHEVTVGTLLERSLNLWAEDAPIHATVAARLTHLVPSAHPVDYQIARLEEAMRVHRENGNLAEAACCAIYLSILLSGSNEANFSRALALAEEAKSFFAGRNDPFYVALALHAIAYAYYFHGDRSTATQLAQECAQVRRNIGDRYGTARINMLIAAEAYSTADYNRAEKVQRETKEIWLQLESWGFISFVNVNLAYLAIFRGDLAEAKSLTVDALRIANETANQEDTAYALAMAGVIAALEQRYSDACEALARAQSLATHPSSIEAIEWGLPLAALALGDHAEARKANLNALHYALRLNAPGRFFWHLPATALLLAQAGLDVRAAEIVGLIESHPASAPAWFVQWGEYLRRRAQLAERLGGDHFDAACQRGAKLDAETVVLESIAWFAGATPARPHLQLGANASLIEPLSAREIEVLNLLAEGLTNPQIAANLIIGEGTVKTHTLNIYRKLDVANRTQAVARGRALGVIDN